MPEDNGDDAILASLNAAAGEEAEEEKPAPTPEEVAKVTSGILEEKENSILIKKGDVPSGILRADAEEKPPETPTPSRVGDADFEMPKTKKAMEKAVCEGKVLFSDIPVNHPYFTG